MHWTDRYSGRSYRVTTRESSSAILVQVATFRRTLELYRAHPEPKSLGPDGARCGRASVGLLFRRPVRVRSLHYIGKESNELDEVEAGLVHDVDEVLNEYRPPGVDEEWTTLVQPVVREMPLARLVERCGKSASTIKNGGRVQAFHLQP